MFVQFALSCCVCVFGGIGGWTDQGDEAVGPENVALRQYLYFCASKTSPFVLATGSTFVVCRVCRDRSSVW
jgi:hypothetical protein